MAHVFADRVRETTATTGTGAFALQGPISGFRAFSAAGVMAINDTCDYHAGAGAKWEQGIATLTSSSTLVRTAVTASTNGGAPENFLSGTKEVQLIMHASRAAWLSSGARGQLSESELSNFGGTSITLEVSAGQCAADTFPYVPIIKTTAHRKTTFAFAEGNGSGGLDTGSITNDQWYHWYRIAKADVSTTDALFSASPTTPVMPSGYVWKRYIGSAQIDGSGNWRLFTQSGDDFLWNAPTMDYTTIGLGTTATSQLIRVPTNVRGIIAKIWAAGSHASGALVRIYSPDQPDTGVVAGQVSLVASSTGTAGEHNVRTNAAGQVRVVSSATNTSLNLTAVGYRNTRGRFA